VLTSYLRRNLKADVFRPLLKCRIDGMYKSRCSLTKAVKLLSVEKGRVVLFIFFIFTSQVFKVHTKVFMRGDAINKHLSVGFWDLVRIRSL